MDSVIAALFDYARGLHNLIHNYTYICVHVVISSANIMRVQSELHLKLGENCTCGFTALVRVFAVRRDSAR